MPHLSPREQQIAACLGKGMSNPQIAEQTGAAVGTVRTQVHRLLQKLDANNRLAIALDRPQYTAEMQHQVEQLGPFKVTPRQMEVAAGLSLGMTHEHIGARLGITGLSAKARAHETYRRLGIKAPGQRLQLALLYKAGRLVLADHRKAAALPAPRFTRQRHPIARSTPTVVKRKLTPTEERWNRIFQDKFEDPDYYNGLRLRTTSPLASL